MLTALPRAKLRSSRRHAEERREHYVSECGVAIATRSDSTVPPARETGDSLFRKSISKQHLFSERMDAWTLIDSVSLHAAEESKDDAHN